MNNKLKWLILIILLIIVCIVAFYFLNTTFMGSKQEIAKHNYSIYNVSGNYTNVNANNDKVTVEYYFILNKNNTVADTVVTETYTSEENAKKEFNNIITNMTELKSNAKIDGKIIKYNYDMYYNKTKNTLKNSTLITENLNDKDL